MLHDNGWLYKRAAEALGMPESTVRTTVHRAVARAGVSDRADLAYWLGVEDARGVRAKVPTGPSPPAL